MTGNGLRWAGILARRCLFPLGLRLPVPAVVTSVLDRLEEKGHEAYLVGGCVRDLLLGRPPEDWDVATDARPETVLAIFPGALPTGIAHGTVTVVTGRSAVEVTTYRVEDGYSDHRRPDRVRYVSDVREDLSRRDVTVNALAMDRRGRLVDPTGGLRDLLRGVVRAVGRPEERIGEDPLRLMRVIRLTAHLGFVAEERTWRAVRAGAPLLRHVSRERIRDEFLKAVTSPAPARAMELFRTGGLLPLFLPEVVPAVQDRPLWLHILETMQAVPPEPDLRLAALFHDLALAGRQPAEEPVDEPPQPPAGPGHAPAEPSQRLPEIRDNERFLPRHARDGAVLAARAMDRLRCGRRLTAAVVLLVRWHEGLQEHVLKDDGLLRRLLARVGREAAVPLAVLRRADCDHRSARATFSLRGGRRAGDPVRRVRALLQGNPPLAVADLALTGCDVMRVTGLGPGPAVGRWLDLLLDRVLEDPSLNTPERLEEVLRREAPGLNPSVPENH